jgi:hypothetical protein
MKKRLAAGLALLALTASACAGGTGKSADSVAGSSAPESSAATAAAATAVNEVMTTEPATEAPQPTVKNTQWKGSYIDYIGKFDRGAFGLVDIDNNGIPELVYDSNIVAYGASICSYANGSLQSIMVASHNIRYESNRILSVSGKMGEYWERVFELNDGYFTGVFAGRLKAKNKDFDTNNPDDFDYSFAAGDNEEQKSASYADYIAARDALIRKDEATVFETPYDKSSIIELIQSY